MSAIKTWQRPRWPSRAGRSRTKLQKLAANDDFEAAREKYQGAYDLQDDISKDFPLGVCSNPGRATRLRREVLYLVAEPMLRESRALELTAEGMLSAKSGRLRAALQAAIEIQDKLNREYRRTNKR